MYFKCELYSLPYSKPAGKPPDATSLPPLAVFKTNYERFERSLQTSKYKSSTNECYNINGEQQQIHCFDSPPLMLENVSHQYITSKGL